MSHLLYPLSQTGRLKFKAYFLRQLKNNKVHQIVKIFKSIAVGLGKVFEQLMYDLCTTYVRLMYDKGLRTHRHSGHCPYAPISTSQSQLRLQSDSHLCYRIQVRFPAHTIVFSQLNKQSCTYGSVWTSHIANVCCYAAIYYWLIK